MTTYNIGVAGYCAQDFDHDDARNQLEQFLENHPEPDVSIVSGLSDIGFWALLIGLQSNMA